MGCGISAEETHSSVGSNNNAPVKSGSIARSSTAKGESESLANKPSQVDSAKSLRRFASTNLFQPLPLEPGTNNSVIYPEPVFVVKISIPGGEKTFIDVYTYSTIVTTFVDPVREACLDRRGVPSTLFHVCMDEKKFSDRNDFSMVSNISPVSQQNRKLVSINFYIMKSID